MLLIIIVLILLLGGFGYGGYSAGWHSGYPAPYYGTGAIILLLLVILLFRGTLW